VRERLVVITRGNEYSPPLIASMRRNPVLVLEPPRDSMNSRPLSQWA
jgi:hypothetical protein